MINLKNDSSNYHLTSYTDGVLFDLSANGVRVRVGWTTPGSLIGILALDRNGNGTIDNGSELFGTATRKRNGRLALHGFDALIDLDGGPDTSDGRIDARDEAYGSLRLWFDDNHDGISQADELELLPSTAVSTLFTAYKEIRRMDRNGNIYRYEGTAVIEKNGKEYKHKLFDVFLVTEAIQ